MKLKILSITLVTLLLTSCMAHEARRGAQSISKNIDKDITLTAESATLDTHAQRSYGQAMRPMRVTKIPRGAPWLRDDVAQDISYRDADAIIAIKRVLGLRPFVFDVIATPIEVNATGAITSDSDDPRYAEVTMPFNAKTIYEHLEAITVQAGLSYSVKQGVVVFTNRVIETFQLRPSTALTDITPIFSAPDGTTAGNDTRSAGFWTSITTSLQQIMGDNGIYTVDLSSNSVTLIGAKNKVEQGLTYLKSIDHQSSRKAKIYFRFLDIDLDSISQRNTNFTIERLTDSFLGMDGIDAGFSFADGLVQGIDSSDGLPSSLNLSVDDDASRLAGAEAMIRFLQGKGAITNSIKTEIVASNNQLYERVVAEQTPYVSEVRTNTFFGGGTSTGDQTSVETETVNDGFSIQFIPTITRDYVTVKLTVENSAFRGFQPYDIGDAQGNLALSALSKLRQTFSLRNGETIALAGEVVERRSKRDRSGIGLGIASSIDASEVRSQQLILVSVKIID